MTHVLLIFMVFFTGTQAARRAPLIEVAHAPEGMSVAECRQHAQAVVARVRAMEGVADVEAQCVELVEKING